MKVINFLLAMIFCWMMYPIDINAEHLSCIDDFYPVYEDTEIDCLSEEEKINDLCNDEDIHSPSDLICDSFLANEAGSDILNNIDILNCPYPYSTGGVQSNAWAGCYPGINCSGDNYWSWSGDIGLVINHWSNNSTQDYSDFIPIDSDMFNPGGEVKIQVRYVSGDGHPDRAGTNQDYEKWRVLFYRNGVYQGATYPTTDVPDQYDYAWSVGTLNVTLPNGATHVRFRLSESEEVGTQSVHVKSVCLKRVCTPPSSGISTSDNNLCTNQCNQFNATPVSGATYEWSANGGAVICGGSASGSYVRYKWATSGTKTITLKVTKNGCEKSYTKTVTVTNVSSGISTSNNSPCANQCNQFNAGTVSGATYQWSANGGAVICGGSENGSYVRYKWATSGTKTITLVVSKGGCTKTYTKTITVKSNPDACAGDDMIICEDSSTNLNASCSSTAESFVWTVISGDFSSIDAGGNTINPTVSPSITTTYQLEVINNGCSDTDVVTVEVLGSPEAHIAASTTSLSCAVTSILLDASASTANGNDIGYLWSGPNGNLGATPTQLVTAPGIYTIKITDKSNDCMDFDSIEIVSLPPPSITIEGEDICEGGILELEAFGSGGSNDYEWSGEGVTSTNANNNPILLDGLSSGTYTYTVLYTDMLGCMVTDTITLDVYTNIGIEAGEDISIQEGNPTQLLATSGFINYHWSPDIAISDTTIPNPIVNPTVSTAYTVTGTLENGCTSTDTVVVNVYCVPEYENIGLPLENYIAGVQFNGINNMTPDGHHNPALTDFTHLSTDVSIGNTYDLTIFSSIHDGYATSILTRVEAWIDYNENGIFEQVESLGQASFDSLSFVTFQVTIPAIANIGTKRLRIRTFLDDFPGPCTLNSCGEAQDYTVNIISCPMIDAGDDVEIEYGGFTQLNASTGFTNYVWTPNEAISDITVTNPIVNPNVSTVYTVTGMGENGCTDTDTIAVYVEGNLNPDCEGYETSANIISTVCFNDSPISEVGDSIFAYIDNEPRGGDGFILSPFGAHLAFISVCGNTEDEGKTISFVYKQSSSGRIYNVEGELVFNSQVSSIGTISEPEKLNIRFDAASLSFDEGYNWFSVPVIPSNGDLSVNSLFGMQESAISSSYVPNNGDLIKSQNDGFTQYVEGFGWFGTLTEINTNQMYKLHTSTGGVLEIEGTMIPESPHDLVTGWNWIGYEHCESDILDNALSSFSPATEDVIKSQNHFAEYVEGFGWFGSLNELAPTQGYKLHVNNDGVLYREVNEECNTSGFSNNMTVVAKILNANGNDLDCESCVVKAIVDGTCRGEIGMLYRPTDNLLLAWGAVHGNQEDHGKIVSFIYIDSLGQEYSIVETTTMDFASGFGSLFSPSTLHLSVPMPVELSYFNAKYLKGKEVQLDWTTASEENNSHFEIERSTDGRVWEFVGKVTGSGTTAIEQTYEFLDQSPYGGIIYYRLKQLDFDGIFEYSGIEVVNMEVGENELILYPNPAKDKITFELFSNGSSVHHVMITDLSGREVLSKELTMEYGVNRKTVDLDNLPKGVYLVQVSSKDMSYVERIIKSSN